MTFGALYIQHDLRRVHCPLLDRDDLCQAYRASRVSYHCNNSPPEIAKLCHPVSSNWYHLGPPLNTMYVDMYEAALLAFLVALARHYTTTYDSVRGIPPIINIMITTSRRLVNGTRGNRSFKRRRDRIAGAARSYHVWYALLAKIDCHYYPPRSPFNFMQVPDFHYACRGSARLRSDSH